MIEDTDTQQTVGVTTGKPARLTHRRQFLRVARSGHKWVTPGLVLQAARQPASDPADQARLGFTVTKKVGNAVVRNRTKRRLRAAAQAVMAPYASAPIDYVLIGRHTTATRPWPLLLQDLETALHQVQIDKDSKQTDNAPRQNRRPAGKAHS